MKPVILTVTFYLVVVLLHFGLALPPALREKSWKRFFIAFGLSFIGIVFPLFIFSASALLVPEWKGACDHGWLNCFHVGKLALLPFVLWASAALYAIEVVRVKNRARRWIVLGIFLGALVSVVCLIIGIIAVKISIQEFRPWLLVPFYVAVWYMLRAVQLARTTGTSPFAYVLSLATTIPFWMASVVLSRKCYFALPDKPPDCFIATAALRGHAAVVGPFVVIARHGQQRQANQQLMTLWCLELEWSRRFPSSHTAFRSFYNAVGPAMASHITSPLAADIVYLAVKPIEFLGKWVVRMTARHKQMVNIPVQGPRHKVAGPLNRDVRHAKGLDHG
jgi:hypothetical protein